MRKHQLLQYNNLLRRAAGFALLATSAAIVSSCATPPGALPDPGVATQPGPDLANVAETLGDDFLLFAVPSDDDTLIGKVSAPGTDTETTEINYQANPCLAHLETKSFEAERTVRDIREIRGDVNGSVLLKIVRVGAAVSVATDYEYEFRITRKLVANDTIEYADCCSKARGACSAHFVRELYYGTGKYRLLQRVSGSASVGVPIIAEISGGRSYAVLGEQSFRGFFAYKTKETPTAAPPPLDDRTHFITTETAVGFPIPDAVEGAAAVEVRGPDIVITTISNPQVRGNQLKAIGSARQRQRRALKNLLAGPPYNTPPGELNNRVEAVYREGIEVDAAMDDNGDVLLKMRYRIK